MSASDLAISVRGLSKAYTITHQQGEKHSTLAESLLARARRPFQKAERETFWALKDVNFDIKKGDVVGIIGRNGAGKSTLLKILSRITEPTTGEIDAYGPIGSLLEVGTGFHPELTGRENIYLNGAILGMARAEIRRQFDAIVAFAGVERFLDTPVKRYSSGMYVRLAFAVAAHLRSDILIVDEVLAVGDAEFQKKCLGKMKDVATGGRTVLFVSHNMAAISGLCTSGVLLSEGGIMYSGGIEEVIRGYSGLVTKRNEGGAKTKYRRPSGSKPMVAEVLVTSAGGGTENQFAAGQPLIFEVRYSGWPSELRPRVMMGIVLKTCSGAPVGAVNMRQTGFDGALSHRGAGAIYLTIDHPPLSPGTYTVDVYIGDGTSDWDTVLEAASFSIESTDYFGTGVAPFSQHGPLLLRGQWSIK